MKKKEKNLIITKEIIEDQEQTKMIKITTNFINKTLIDIIMIILIMKMGIIMIIKKIMIIIKNIIIINTIAIIIIIIMMVKSI